MADTLKDLGRKLGKSYTDIEILKSRNGLLPQLERTRGNVIKANSFIANFHVNQPVRKVGLKLTFFKASIL
jgi:hypothetical protein